MRINKTLNLAISIILTMTIFALMPSDATATTYGQPGEHCGFAGDATHPADSPCAVPNLICLYNRCVSVPLSYCESSPFDCSGDTGLMDCVNNQCRGRHAYPCNGPRDDPICAPGFHCDTSNPGYYYCEQDHTEYCGDGVINQASETCELPSTSNNAYCSQTTNQCQGTKLGTRDAFGNCDSACGCIPDQFNYQCVKGQCGASCAVNADCDDGNIHTTDTCDVSNCSCKHETIPYCGDNILSILLGETCELPGTSNNAYCSQTNSTCLGTKLGTRDAYGNCNSACGCVPDNFNYQCTKGKCGATCQANTDCNDCNANTVDTCLDNCTCKHTPKLFCGDNIISSTLGEKCEKPSTTNNAYCTQSTSQCSGTKYGTRDAYGNCNSACGCAYDSFSYKCVKGKCGATCASNTDCNDNNCKTIDTCNSSCGCVHTLVA